MGNKTPVIEQRDTIVLPEAADDYITCVNALKNGKIAAVQQSEFLSIVNMKNYTVNYRDSLRMKIKYKYILFFKLL